MPKEYRRGQQFAMGHNAYKANRLVGERMVADEVEWLGNKGTELLADYDRLKPPHNFTTFETVEWVWKEVVEPALSGFKTMQEMQGELPPDSPWKANSGVPGNWRGGEPQDHTDLDR